jgi:hypothetical protein
MNPSADTQIIYPGTIVAQVSPVQEVVNPNLIKYTYTYAPTSTHIHLCIYTHTYACIHIHIHIYNAYIFMLLKKKKRIWTYYACTGFTIPKRNKIFKFIEIRTISSLIVMNMYVLLVSVWF